MSFENSTNRKIESYHFADKFPTVDGWDIRSGDYIVDELAPDNSDFYYKERERFRKIYFNIAIALVGILVYSFSYLLSKL